MIKIGEELPDVDLKVMSELGPEKFNILSNLKDKKAVLFAVPGAFTPTCSAAHLPGFIDRYDELLNRGVDLVACISVNDVFVMDAWGKSTNAKNILMLADGNATFSKAIGLDKDASNFDMGVRSKRYAMIVENGIVSHVEVDELGLENASAEAILNEL